MLLIALSDMILQAALQARVLLLELLLEHVVESFHLHSFLVDLPGLEEVESIVLIEAVVGGASVVPFRGVQAAIALASLTCHTAG